MKNIISLLYYYINYYESNCITFNKFELELLLEEEISS